MGRIVAASVLGLALVLGARGAAAHDASAQALARAARALDTALRHLADLEREHLGDPVAPDSRFCLAGRPCWELDMSQLCLATLDTPCSHDAPLVPAHGRPPGQEAL